MKKRIFLSLAILLAMGNISIFSQNAEKFLEELTTSQWKAKSPANVVSMRDGERFAYVSDNKKQIIVDYYKSSKPEVIFDVDKVEKSPVKQVEWFQFDDSEGRILLLTNSRPVYRRSSIGSYYVYDINRRRITPVSENGAGCGHTFGQADSQRRRVGWRQLRCGYGIIGPQPLVGMRPDPATVDQYRSRIRCRCSFFPVWQKCFCQRDRREIDGNKRAAAMVYCG